LNRPVTSFAIVASCGVLLAIAASADSVRVEDPTKPISVTMKEGRGGVRKLEGRFHASATVETVLDVLTDYQRLPSFVSNIRSSEVLNRENRRSVVEQVMIAKMGPFRKKIFLQLEVFETPTSLTFRDVSGRSFDSYEGSWGVIDQGEFVEVVYELQAKPAFFSPAFATGHAFRSAVERLLAEVRNEIERRDRARPG
jgi:hypothetical protein